MGPRLGDESTIVVHILRPDGIRMCKSTARGAGIVRSMVVGSVLKVTSAMLMAVPELREDRPVLHASTSL